MSRFAALYQHFEATMGRILEAMPELDRKNLVFVYRDGLYRVYESYGDDPKPPRPVVEVNAAQALTSLHEVWFFDEGVGGGLAAHVEYQPDYRPPIRITDPGLPLIQFHEKRKPPYIAGLH